MQPRASYIYVQYVWIYFIVNENFTNMTIKKALQGKVHIEYSEIR